LPLKDRRVIMRTDASNPRRRTVTLLAIAACLAAAGYGAQPAAGGAPVSLDDFQLPSKAVFDRAMPRYPNAWFHVDAALAPSHREAVKLVTDASSSRA
jgi:hypothetical protein